MCGRREREERDVVERRPRDERGLRPKSWAVMLDVRGVFASGASMVEARMARSQRLTRQ